MVFLWFSYGFPRISTVFPWFSYGFPMVFRVSPGQTGVVRPAAHGCGPGRVDVPWPQSGAGRAWEVQSICAVDMCNIPSGNLT